MAKYRKKPVIVAYGVKNRTSEHINTQTFMKDLERAFLRSGTLPFRPGGRVSLPGRKPTSR